VKRSPKNCFAGRIVLFIYFIYLFFSFASVLAFVATHAQMLRARLLREKTTNPRPVSLSAFER
jgi:hypothetical protein